MRIQEFKDAGRFWRFPDCYALPHAARGTALIATVEVYVEIASERVFHVCESEGVYCESKAPKLPLDAQWTSLEQ